MNKTWKSVLCILLAAWICAMTLTACTTNEETDSTQTDADTAEQTEQGTESEQTTPEQMENPDPTGFESDDLEFEVNADQTSCTVVGVKMEKPTRIEIPAEAQGYVVTGIGTNAFANCAELTEVAIPESVVAIGANAFAGCKALIVKENGVGYVGKWIVAFDEENAEELLNVTMRQDTIGIADAAFANSVKLGTLVISDSIQNIGASAFAGCNQLREVVIPESVKRIRQKAFAGCNKLLQNENGVLYVGNWAVDFDKSVNEIVIRDGTVGIAEYTFFLIEDLVSITLPDSLRHIGGYAITFIRVGEWELIFKGTPEEWETIEKAYGWDGSSTYSMIFTNNAKQ